MVTSDIRKYFHAHFVKSLTIFSILSRGKLLEFWKHIRNYFLIHKYAIWLPINIMGDKYSTQWTV